MRQVCTNLAIALLTLAFGAAPASAASVLVLHGHRVSERDEPIAAATGLPAPPSPRRTGTSRARVRAAKARKAPAGRYARQALDALLAGGQVDQPTHDRAVGALNDALRAARAKTATRRTELTAVIANADSIARAGQLTASRVNPITATLAANAQWWTSGPLLANGRRVSIGDSQIIWQYYRGQGLELQMLANWGKANGLYLSHDSSGLRALVDELIPLAADRGGWPAWEYYFRFGGGAPPWTSSISQGTAIQALARASQRLKDPALAALGSRALAAFEQPPPAGVRVDQPDGPFYVIYSFAPDELVLNADLQAVTGLYDFAQITGDPRAQALFSQGDAEARAVVPRYDTGSWSLYDQRGESDLSYHQLVTTFLDNLCKRTSAPVYCDTGDRFKTYEDEPPVVSPSTSTLRAGRSGRLYFTLDKISRVGVVVTRGAKTVFSTSAVVGRGRRFFSWRPPAAGEYSFRARATDLAGNQSDPADVALRVVK